MQWIYEAGIRTDMYHEHHHRLHQRQLRGHQGHGHEDHGRHQPARSCTPDRTPTFWWTWCPSRSKLVCAPMPNLYFTRDPFAMIGNGVSINRMYSVTRNRETIYGEYIFKYHPDFAGTSARTTSRNNTFHIEGGDILNINEHVLAIGISQRTEPDAIDAIAHNVFNDETSPIDTILAFNIPNSRAFMHLDTVFTQIDVRQVHHPSRHHGPAHGVRDHPGRQGRHEDPRAQRGSREGALRVRRPAGEAHPLRRRRPHRGRARAVERRLQHALRPLRAPWWCTSATTSPTTCCTSRASTASRCPRPSSPAAVAARAACPCRPGARLCKPQGARSVKEHSYVRLFRPSLASQRWAVKEARVPRFSGAPRDTNVSFKGKETEHAYQSQRSSASSACSTSPPRRSSTC